MVKDDLGRISRYTSLGPHLATALRHAAGTDFRSWTIGEHQVDGTRVRVQVQRYTSKSAAEGRWEAHRRHIDLQMVAEGVERIGIAPLETLVAEPYDADKDLLWASGTGDSLLLRPGDFLLLWPEDGHMPGLQADGPAEVLKVVYKIVVD